MPNLKLGTTTVVSANNNLVSFPTGTLSGTLGDSASLRGITFVKDSNGYFVANIKPRYISSCSWSMLMICNFQELMDYRQDQ